ncbi:MAG: DUF4056 domain-containing protein [Sedimentisphaerales bacterium]|nr:DUF4056 domain-containing protein [Sedimentisphaerales bacterium]
MNRLDSNLAGKIIVVSLLVSFTITLIGCGGSGGVKGGSVTPLPKIRIGRYASPSVGTVFENPDRITRHSYSSGAGSKGIVYTCRAGHVDLAHARKSADWTAYLYRNFVDRLSKKETHLAFKFREPANYDIYLTYPANWDTLPAAQKQAIIKDSAATLAQYGAYVGTMFHEMLTWFGYKSTGVWSEFPSAFAWEDTFSDLFGTHIAGIALRDPKRDYDDAMTYALAAELKKLGVQPKKIAHQASVAVGGHWYSGDFMWINMKARNFDIGFDDGYITPFLVPGFGPCPGAKPVPYPAPKLDDVRKYGFGVKFELNPGAKKGKVMKIIWPDKKQRQKRVVPDLHFNQLIQYILKDADRRGIRSVPDFEK